MMGPNSKEEILLGILLQQPQLLEVSAHLSESLFSTRDRKKIFGEICEQWQANKTIDELQISQKTGISLEQIFNFQFGLQKFNPEAFSQLVDDTKVKQLTGELVLNLEKQLKLFLTTDEWEKVEVEKIKAKFEEIENLSRPCETIENFLFSSGTDQLRGFIETKRKARFWGFELNSFPKLTRALMGLREIVVLAAEPKTGKSTLILQIASEIAEQKAGVLYYDMENGRTNLMARELCRRGDIKFRDELFVESFSWDEILKELTKLYEIKNFAIITDRKLSIENIRGHIKRMREKLSRKEILVVIDSLQKLPMKSLAERRAAIDLWLRGFEELKAEDPYLTILLVSELSREGKKPKESGDIEYTGHFLLELEADRTAEEMEQFGDDGVRNLWIRFARDVERPNNPIKLKADFDYWRFSEL